MARKDQEEWIPNDHHIYHPVARSNARPSRRGHIKTEPSILDMLEEEEIAATVRDPSWSPHMKTEDAPTRKRKKESASDIADNKKRRLMKTANKFSDKAREKETLKWHRNCRWFKKQSVRSKVPPSPRRFHVVEREEECRPSRRRAHQRQHENVLRQVLGRWKPSQRGTRTQVAQPRAHQERTAAAQQVEPSALPRDARHAEGSLQGSRVARARPEEHRGVRSDCDPKKKYFGVARARRFSTPAYSTTARSGAS